MAARNCKGHTLNLQLVVPEPNRHAAIQAFGYFMQKDYRVEMGDERATAELRRLNAEAIKLEAEARRFRQGMIIDGGKLALAAFAAAVAALKFVESQGWL